MTDEQPVPIYLSPEEELTSVRERLEKTQARKIMLVIPPQTQLRSHVGWRLIHARMRELGKELIVISPDRQVRAVARAAGFQVAESQESPSNRPRLGGSRPGNTRGAARSRIGSSRHPASRGSQQTNSGRRQMPGASNRPLTPLPPAKESFDDEMARERSGPDIQESQPLAPPPTLFKTPEPPRRSLSDFHISTTPSIHPSMPGQSDDDDDSSDDYDYRKARSIRESASAGGRREIGDEDGFSSRRDPESQTAVPKRWTNDPFIYMEDEHQPSPLPEQKGSVPGPFDEVEAHMLDISDRSTEIMEPEIVDLGDLGAITPPPLEAIPRPAAPPREPTARPRRPSGQMRQHSPRSPRPGSPGLDDDDDDLLAIPDKPTRADRPSRGLSGTSRRPSQAFRGPQTPQTSQRPSRGLRPDNGPQQSMRPSRGLRPDAVPQQNQRPSRGLDANPQPQTSQRPSRSLKPEPAPMPQQSQRPVALAGQRVRPGSAGPRTPVLPPPGSRQSTRNPRPTRRNRRGVATFFMVLFGLLIVLALLYYFVPSATVTIALQARSYSQNVTLKVSANPSANVPGSVQAQVLEHDFSLSGQGSASGQTKVGNSQAQGLVTFTNNGNKDLTVPNGTLITTQSGIPFATTAEIFVPAGQSQPAVPVSAQEKGVAGNVAANTITSIPQSSLASIARDNHTTTSNINLTVTNPQATSGGGARNEPAVTQQDLQALAKTLHHNLQQAVTAWLAGQMQTGDQHGTPIPNVLGSANPLPVEQLSNVPSVNQAESSGTFSGTLAVHIKVLVARAAALKAAAGTLLNAAALKQHPVAMLANQLPITLSGEKNTSAADGSTFTISASAAGSLIGQIPLENLSSTLTGQSVSSATSLLRNTFASAGVQDVQISVTPAFLSILPLQASRIQIILQPIPQAPPKPASNK